MRIERDTLRSKWSPLTEKEWWNRKIPKNIEWELRKPNRSKAEFHGFKRLFDTICNFYNFDERRVLDAGSGTGWLSQWILESFQPDKVMEYDISEVMIRLSYESLKVFHPRKTTFSVGDIQRMPFREDSFDVCIVIDTLHHTADPSKTLQELARIAPNLILFEPNKLNPIRRFNERIFIGSGVKEISFFKTDLIRMLVHAGFNTTKVLNIKWISESFPETFFTCMKPLEALLEKIPVLKEFSGALLAFASRNR